MVVSDRTANALVYLALLVIILATILCVVSLAVLPLPIGDISGCHGCLA